MSASASRIKLTTIIASVATLGHSREKPSVYLSPTAHAISLMPASRSRSQAVPMGYFGVPAIPMQRTLKSLQS